MKTRTLLPILLASASFSQGAIIIGNLAAFNNNDATTTGINYNPANPSATPPTGASYGNKAVSFVMGSSAYEVTSLSLRLSGVSGVTDPPSISIWSGTSAPVSQVGTFTNPASFSGAPSTTYVFTPASAFTLSANTSYFIVVQQLVTTGPDYGFVWDNGNTIANNPNTQPTGVGATNGIAAFGSTANATGITSPSSRFNWYQLEGNVVPEPSSAILALGSAALFLRRNRRS